MNIPIRAFRPLTAAELSRLRTVGGNPPPDSVAICRHCGEDSVLTTTGWTHLIGARTHDAEPVITVEVL